MSEYEQNIVIISPIDSFLTRSISARFKQDKINCSLISTTENGIKEINEKVSAGILYLDSELAQNSRMLTMIKDRVVECDVPLFLVGRVEDIAEASGYLSEDVIKDTFMRPVDVSKIVETITGYLSFYGNEFRKVILCVDDSGVELRSIKNIFEDSYSVMLADSFVMAIKSMTLKRPDLILLDYSMPIINGKQVFEMIKSEGDFSNIPIMFLTAMDDRETATNLMQLRPEAYILKGTPASEIRGTVDGFFARKKA